MSDYRIRLSGLDFGLQLTADSGLEDTLQKALEAAARFFLDLDAAPADAAFASAASVHRGAGGWRMTLVDGRSMTYSDPDRAMHSIAFELDQAIIERPDSRLLLHAGSVVRSGAACAFMAGPDSGKTTSALHCLELGAEFLTEEITAVELDSWQIAPHLRSLSTGPAHVQRLARRFPLEAGRLELLTDLEARYVPSRLHRAPAPLRTIVLPKYDPHGAEELEDTRASEVLTEVVGYCFEPRLEHERFIDGLIALLSQCRILRLRYRDGEGARGLLSALSGMLDEAARVTADRSQQPEAQSQ